MFNSKLILLTVLSYTCLSASWAEMPTALDYQGRISVAGKPFSGRGYFTFAVLDGTGEVLWASGPLPMQQTTNLPPGVISLMVSNGLYAIRLGNAAAGMPALDGPIVAGAFLPKLRIWFNDGSHGWQQAGKDIPMSNLIPATDKLLGGATSAASTEAILRELRQLRLMLERQRITSATPMPKPTEPTVVTVPIGDEPALGNPDAPVVLVEFTDYQCPFCKRFQDAVLPELVKTYVTTGKLRIVSRNLPLDIHTNAEPAALAALCALEQQQFWPMRDRLFASANALSATNFIGEATAMKLDLAAFRACLEKPSIAAQLKKDAADARAAGISGTPSFVLGKPADGRVTGLLIVGARPVATFEAEIKRLLGTTR